MTTKQAEKAIANCSFCMKPNTDVERLVAGPGVYICNECVELCDIIIGDQKGKPRATNPLNPWEQEFTLEDALANLPRVAAACAQAERSLTEWVRKSRGLGATWARIGEALGTTRQSAWERFSGEE